MSAKAVLLLGSVGIGIAMLVASQNSKAANNPSPGAPSAKGFGPMRRGATYHVLFNQKQESDGAISLTKTVQIMTPDGWQGITTAFDPNGGVMVVATWNGADGAMLPASSPSGPIVYTSVQAVS